MNTIGRYQLLEKLGQGGMGVVHRAVDPLLQRTVAVKLISSAIDTDEELRERFFREARAAGQLSHKNIITIYDLGEHEGQPFLAMEFLEGQDLQQRLAAGPPMTLARKLELAIEICEGIEYAHVHGVVHRDIKPANIFITTAGTVKLLDFGLARLITSELTHTNMMMGTLNYMAPEQVRGERADHRSDIFSTGVVLYEVFAGRKAFEGDSFGATLYKILEECPEPLPNLDASLPLPLVGVVDQAMRKNRDERYQHMSEMLGDLIAYRQQLGLYNSPSSGRPASGAVSSSRGSDAPTMAHAPAIAPTPPAGAPPTGAPAPTPLPLAAPRATDGPAGRRPLVISAITGAVLLGGAALWMSRRDVPAPAPTVQNRPAPAPVAPPQPAPAVDDAQQRAQRVATGLENAQSLLAAGRHEEASRAASEVMALEPANPEARRVIDESAAASRGKGAEEAQQRMHRAKAAATAADAPTYAPRAFASAMSAEREAATLFKRGRAAEAMSKFWEATGLFTGAEGAARTEAAARAERARVAASEQKTAAAAPRQDPEPPAPKPGAPTPQQPAAPIPSTTGLPLPPVPQPDAPAAAARPNPPSPAAEPPLPPASPTSGIGEVLDRYKAALESRSLDGLKRLWPGLRGAQESAIRTEFQNASSINVEIVNPQTTLRGTTATVTFVRRYQLETVDRQRLRTETRTTMHLQRSGNTWTIDQMTFEPVR
jgi:hypothetical protein